MTAKKILIGICACAFAAGCAHLGDPVATTPLPEGTPDLKPVLEALAANDDSIHSLRAGGEIVVDAPSLEAVQRFPTGTVAYERPDKLYVEGRLRTGIIAFQLQSVGDEYLIEFPTQRDEDRYWDKAKVEDAEVVPFDVSPADVVREMFLPEDWAALKVPRDARITAYDIGTQQVTFTVGPKKAIRRTVVVEGPPWRVVRSERYDESGAVIAITDRSEYNTKVGIQLPAHIASEFPQQSAQMTFNMRNIRINTDLDPTLFIINWQSAK